MTGCTCNCTQGRIVSFKNALIVMTSNIGSRLISSSGGLRGAFTRNNSNNNDDGPSADPEAAFSSQAWQADKHGRGQERDEGEEAERSQRKNRVRETVLDEIKQFFRPEFINR